MHELAFGTSTINPIYGTSKSGVDPSRISGGSSGGSGGVVGS